MAAHRLTPQKADLGLLKKQLKVFEDKLQAALPEDRPLWQQQIRLLKKDLARAEGV